MTAANAPLDPSTALATRLRAFVSATLDDLVARHLPGWRIPGSFGGHRVEPDVAADLVYTLGHLAAGGVTEIAGTPIDAAIAAVLRRIDGAATHTFFSYRVAETLGRHGPFTANPLLDGFIPAQLDEVRAACDSSEWIPLLDEGILPRNYAAVLARCELARLGLGLLDDGGVVDTLVERLADLLATNPRRYLDDSNGRVGRYDIYTADVWLFTEPLAPRLGPLWDEGLATALDLVDVVATGDGTAVPWGRSTGVLGLALTVELAALALAPGRSTAPERWLARATTATDAMSEWFSEGVVRAHQHRSPYGYRGPFRRLQLTLDILGKLAWAANHLPAPPSGAAHARDARVSSAADGDRMVRFEDERPAAVWVHRSPALEVVVPFVGATRSDYLAAPHRPGLFEVPVDTDIPCWVPLVVHKGKRFTLGGLPSTLDHDGSTVTATWDGLALVGELDPPADQRRLAGRGTARYAIEGRTVRLDVDLSFDVTPQAVTLLVPETSGRALHVAAGDGAVGDGSVGDGATGTAHLDTVDVDGIAEWRSFWGTFGRVHQVDLEPAQRVAVSVRVTPQLRVSSSAHGHHYHRSLYGPLAGRVVDRRPAVGTFADRRVRLDDLDLFHLHWPEWTVLGELAQHEQAIAALADAGVPIVWTAHNLVPHDKGDHDAAYRAWAAAADALIHHSAWGRDRFLDRYPEARGARHEVIPHGHFGDLYGPDAPDRDAAEAALGLTPCSLRVGLLGAPRHEKHVQAVLDAVTRCRRDDVQLACWSLAPGDVVPDDPRVVVAEAYEMVEPATYALRLAACDVLALPFDPAGDMLATGTVADAVGLGLAALVSDWGYLREALGDAGIPAGHEPDTIAAAIDALDPDRLAAAKAATAALRPALDWSALAERTLALFEAVVADPTRRASGFTGGGGR